MRRFPLKLFTSYFLFAAEAIGVLILGFVVGLILKAIVPIPSAVIIPELILKMMFRRTDFQSNVSPIREGSCTARFRVSDTRCGTYLI